MWAVTSSAACCATCNGSCAHAHSALDVLQISGETTGDMSGDCISLIFPGTTDNDMILGAPFLRAWYTAYHYDPTTKAATVSLAKPRTLDALIAST